MDSKRLAEIADVMEDRGLTRVRVEEPDGTAVELERASAAQPVAVPMPMPSAMAAPVAAPTVAPAAPEPQPRPGEAAQQEDGGAFARLFDDQAWDRYYGSPEAETPAAETEFVTESAAEPAPVSEPVFVP